MSCTCFRSWDLIGQTKDWTALNCSTLTRRTQNNAVSDVLVVLANKGLVTCTVLYVTVACRDCDI
jgi:hypothetical protein